MQDARAAGIDPLWGCIFRNGNVSRELCAKCLLDYIHNREVGRMRYVINERAREAEKK